jgi:hypothetical protein
VVLSFHCCTQVLELACRGYSVQDAALQFESLVRLAPIGASQSFSFALTAAVLRRTQCPLH